MIPQYAIEQYLARRPRPIPRFKGVNERVLYAAIQEQFGIPFRPAKTPPRGKHQLEGVAFALYRRRALLLYDMRLGKALYHHTNVVTPDGWRCINTLQPGDYITGIDGEPTQVTGVYPQGARQMYRVTFNDGAVTLCDGEHLWAVNTAVRKRRGNPWQVKTLHEIIQKPLRDPSTKGWYNFIPMPAPIDYPNRYLFVEPYLLGVLLGDGHFGEHHVGLSTDQEIVSSLVLPINVTAVKDSANGRPNDMRLVSPRGQPNILVQAIRTLGLNQLRSHNKFIPEDYLTASMAQRWELLCGLLDTDGWYSNNNLGWGTTSAGLMNDMRELVGSFGGTLKSNTKSKPYYTYKGERKIGQVYYHGSIRLPSYLGCPFRLKRKADLWRPLVKYEPQRAIIDVQSVRSAEAICIKVDRPDGLFIIDDYVVTHNTWIALNWAEHLRKAGQWQGKGLVIVHAPIALNVWEAEAPKHSNLKVRIVRTKLSELIEAMESDCDLIIVPWSGLQQIFTEKRSVKVHKLVNKKSTFVRQNKMQANYEMANLAAEAFSIVIIDEIHKAKNKATIRFKIAMALTKQCSLRLGLTGTPFGRAPFDLWAQAYLIDNGGTLGINYNFFCEAFGKRVKNKQSSKYSELIFDGKKEPLLRERMDTLSLSYERAEVHDVNILTGQIELHMIGEQREAYERAIDYLIKVDHNEHVEMLNSFVRLRQISSGYLPFIDNAGNERIITFPYNPKVAWLSDLFEEKPSIQIIIFHEFTRSGQMICDVLKEAGVSHGWLYGATRNTAEVVQKFNSGESRVLVANTAKGGLSIDLPTADYIVFFESPTSPVVRQQAEARPMSRGSKLLMIDDMVTSGVELKILSFIKEGRDLLASLVHDRKGLRTLDLARA